MELKFVNDKVPENHYMVYVQPSEHRLSIEDQDVVKVHRLKDGSKASFMTNIGFNILVFERANWQYVLSIDKRVADQVSPETLVEIAESIN
ncbi:hypothetical protein [Risungbinella massiliensis]|uniref:hypothetical protein n=1 Tax=Risungbinella massiliensis TaxID=1329796 RepID=UPI0011C8FD69|nr:hypothetical protein [Risungbinella massiliensis]